MSDKTPVTGQDIQVRGISVEKRLHFLKLRWVAFALSGLIIAGGIVAFFTTGGFKLGIDFLGGARVEMQIASEDADLISLREMLLEEWADSEVTTIGALEEKNFLITITGEEGASTNDIAMIESKVAERFGVENIEVRGSTLVGPKMGEAFARRALILVLIVAGMILAYVALRFDFFYGAGAIIAVFHDILIMLTFCLVLDIRIDIAIIAALLTILGYSINDTIVVFDRVRENHKLNPDEDYEYTMDKSIGQSLSRTIITSVTTLLVAIAIAIWGGSVLRNFGIMLIIGVLSGTYSSIFTASPVTFTLKKLLDKKIKLGDKEGKKKLKGQKA
jgi:preprotein translocase SecF subunit